MEGIKRINIDDSSELLLITIGGKCFAIACVTMEVMELYSEYLKFKEKHIKNMAQFKNDAIEKLNEKYGENKWQSMPSCAIDFPENVSGIIEKYKTELAEKNKAIVGKILEKNGYAFDEEWFAKNTTFSSIELFIKSAIEKKDVL